jgi:glycosyltransferase involved in cell wall biosynthesis
MGIATLHLSYTLLQPDAVIAGSRFYLDRAQRFGRPDRTYLIYHGVDGDVFYPLNTMAEVRSRYEVPNDHALLVSVGRLKPRKGFLDLIRAVGIVQKTGRPLSLVIAGTLNSASITYVEKLRNEVSALGLTQAVHFDNSIAHSQIPWLLGGSDIVVQASHEEGLGYAVIEAMLCGRPVVATRIPGHTEVIEDDRHAVLVEPASPNQLAAAIANLLDDEGRRAELGANARARAIDHFSLRRMTHATAELLEQVTKRATNDAKR